MEILRTLLKTRDGIRDETPFTRACFRADPTVMIYFVRNCPIEFVMGREDLTGIGKSIFNFVLTKLTNSSMSSKVVKECLKRGAKPDENTFDDVACIESLIANEQYSGAELKRMIKLLLKYGAKPTNGALIKLMRLSFRTDEELFLIAKILLKSGSTRLLLNKQAYKLWSSHRKESNMFKPFELASRDGQSVCIEVFKNPTFLFAKTERFLALINQYADISAMFPDADGIAIAIGERIGLDPSDDLYLDLDSALRLILRFTCSHRIEEELRIFLNRLHRGILKDLFERLNFGKSDKDIETMTSFAIKCIEIMDNLQFDFNALVDGQIGLFSVFHPNVPDETVIKVLESLPKSFYINVKNGNAENIASLVIRRYAENFQTVRKIFELLKSLDFDFTQRVHGGQTLLMMYVSKCGEKFDIMKTEDRMTAFIEVDFFSVMRFLFHEKCDMTHRVPEDDFKNKEIVTNVLSVAMSLTHSAIAEEILKLNPNLLDGVNVERVLAFIQQCPQVLEFLNGRSMVDEEKKCTGSFYPKHEHAGRAFLKRNFNSGCTTDIRATWLRYIQINHDKILQFVGEQEENDYSKQVELIYDYLVHCEFPDEEDNEYYPRTVAMEFSVFRRTDLNSYDIYRKDKERVNARLFLKIVDECQAIVKHPLFTEYFEKFYRKAFFNSVAFILFHIIFLVLLMYTLTYSLPLSKHNDTKEAHGFTNAHYECRSDSCRINKTLKGNLSDTVKLIQFEYGGYVTKWYDKSDNENCTACEIHTVNNSICSSNISRIFCPFHGSHETSLSIVIGQYLLVIMATLGLLREIVQFILDPFDYFESYMQNMVEVFMYVFVLLFCLKISGECKWSSGFKQPWQYEIGSIAVLNSWFMMFFYTSKFPAFATYVIMFYQSVKSGLWLLITFSSLIFGFGFSLHFLLKNQNIYGTMDRSMNKVWMMMAGEIDYKSTFLGLYKKESEIQPEDRVHFEVLTRLILFIFVLLITIVLMNLFIGLIVGDVEKINKEAELKKWRWNLEFIEYTESMFEFLRKWSTRIRASCQKKHGIRVLGQMEKDRRSTRYLQQVQSGHRKLLVSESLKMGLHVTDLTWRNAFKWIPIAKFFGFVDRTELIKRLMAGENRKRRLKKQYGALRRFDQDDNDDNEPERLKRHFLPIHTNLCVDNPASDTESEVSIHSTVAVHMHRPQHDSRGNENLNSGSMESLTSISDTLPRHEREPSRLPTQTNEKETGGLDELNIHSGSIIAASVARLGLSKQWKSKKITR